MSFGSSGGLLLLEPVTGQLSDALFIESAQSSPSGPTTYLLSLSSDNESGTFAPPALAVLGCSLVSPPCLQTVEDGSFQLASSGLSTTAGSFDVYLKSDLNAVPEGPTLILLLTGALTALMPWARRAFRQR